MWLRGNIVTPRFVLTVEETRYIELQRDGNAERFDFEPLNSYPLQLENVYECLFDNGKPSMPLEESIQNLHVISALLKSGQTGEIESVE